jgi:hypothetical protein
MHPYRSHAEATVVCTLCAQEIKACGRCGRLFKSGERLASNYRCMVVLPANPFHALFIAMGLAVNRERRWKMIGHYIVFPGTPHYCVDCG